MGTPGWATVWHVVVPGTLDPDVEATLLAALAPEERRRAGDATGVVGRALLRAVLGAGLGVAPPEVALAASPDGKPLALAAIDAGLHANVSHAERHVVVAATGEGPVGVDVEVIDRHPERVARRFLDPDERALLAGAPPARRDAAFYRLWTVKEACAKAHGTGLRSLRSMPATLDRTGTTGGARWQAVDLGPGLAATVAVLGDHAGPAPPPVDVVTLTVDQVVAAVDVGDPRRADQLGTSPTTGSVARARARSSSVTTSSTSWPDR